MKFKKVQVLLHSEGEILTIVERIDDPNKEQLYIVGLVLECRCKLICKTNIHLIEMLFQGRISVSDLFKTESHEYYIIEYKQKQEKVFFDDAFESILSTLECGDKHYYQLSQNMRLLDAMECLRVLKRDYIHSFASVPAFEHNYSGQSFVERHPHLFKQSTLQKQHMETQLYTYSKLKELLFSSNKNEVIFKQPINWNGNVITGIFKNHKMIGCIDEDSSNYNISRSEGSTYYKMLIDSLLESV